MNIKLWSLLLVALLIAGCKKDERSPEELILGKWDYESFKDDCYKYNHQIESWELYTSDEIVYNPGELIKEFLFDGTGSRSIFADSSFIEYFTWKIEGNKLFSTLLLESGQWESESEFYVDEEELITTVTKEGISDNFNSKSYRYKRIYESYYRRLDY